MGGGLVCLGGPCEAWVRGTWHTASISRIGTLWNMPAMFMGADAHALSASLAAQHAELHGARFACRFMHTLALNGSGPAQA